MNWIGTGVTFVALGVIVAFVALRFVGHDPKVWHVDPETFSGPRKANQFLLAGPDAAIVDASPEKTAAAFHDVATGDGAVLLAGSREARWMTYVQTTPLIGFPDYISVKIAGADGKSRLSVFSRSRFGYSDLGANRRRVERWLADLQRRL